MKLTIGDNSISFSMDAVKRYKNKEAFVSDIAKRHKIAEEEVLREKLSGFYDLINPPKKGKQ